jgi:hypothetical protein
MRMRFLTSTAATAHRSPKFGRALSCAVVAALVVSVAAPEATQAATKTSSVYLSLKDCTQIDGPKAPDDNQDWGEFRCGRPVGGWQVYLTYGDARENITLKRNKVATSLDLWQIHGSFSEMGPTLEFRVRSGRPYAAVMRHIIDNPEDPNIRFSYLMVAKLTPKPCIVADFEPGPNQSALARAAADTAPSLECLRKP